MNTDCPDSVIDSTFLVLVETIGRDATPEQSDRVVDFITTNYGRAYWAWAAEQCLFIGTVYTDISERLGEFGEY